MVGPTPARLHSTSGMDVEAALAAATSIPLVLCSRAGVGPTMRGTYGYPGGEIDLLERGLLWGGFLTGPKARLLLTLCLMSAPCLLYTSDAADDLLCVDLGGRRIIKKK